MDGRDGLAIGGLCVLLVCLGLTGVGSAAPEPVGVAGATTGSADVTALGNGQGSNGTQIASVDDLQAMADDLSAEYVLVSDINASGSASSNNGSGFEPVGDADTPFTGSLDGNGHTITGLTINRSGEDEVGLFGRVGLDGTVHSVRLEDASVTGGNETGMLAGQLRGTASNVSANGDVDGAEAVGGLVGRADKQATVRNTRSTGSVTGDDAVGGLIGQIGGTASVDASYTTSELTVDGGTKGGLIASKTSIQITVTSSYYLQTIANDSVGPDVTPLSQDQLTGENAKSNLAEFAFPGVWIIPEDTDGPAYPELARWYTIPVQGSVVGWASGTAVPEATITIVDTGKQTHPSDDGTFTLSLVEGFDYTVNATASIDGGTLTDSTSIEAVDGNTTLAFELSPSLAGAGTGSDPYTIQSAAGLQAIATEPSAHYELTADVAANDTSEWNGGAGFDPIGEYGNDSTSGFSGSLDGNEHTITGLTIDRGDEEYVGLFGSLESSATVRELELETTDVTGGLVTGGLTARASSGANITGVTLSGDVSGELNVGGLVGQSAGTIDRSASHATVEARTRAGVLGSNAGGLVGHDTGRIERSFATGSVDAAGENAGGLVGLVDSSGRIVDSYATGDATAERRAGGLVGELSAGTVESSYATGTVTGTPAGALLGSGSPESVTDAYWINGTRAYGTAEANTTGLSEEQLSGSEAPTAMSGLDFETTWVAVDNGGPLLAWEVSGNDLSVTPATIELDETATIAQQLVLTDGTIVNATDAGQFSIGGDASSVATINGSNTVQPVAPGTATVSATVGDDTATVEVLAPEFTVRVDDTTGAAAGESVTVTATVENVGQGYGTATVVLKRGGQKLASTKQSLDTGANATVELAWQTARSDAGEYDLTVETDDDQASTSVTVTEPTEGTAGANETAPGNSSTGNTTDAGNESSGASGSGLLSLLLKLSAGFVLFLLVAGVTVVVALPRAVGVDSIDDVQVNTEMMKEDLRETFGPVLDALPFDAEAMLASLAATLASTRESIPIDLGAMAADIQETAGSAGDAIPLDTDAMKADIQETIASIQEAIQERRGDS